MQPVPVNQQQALVERLMTACGGSYTPETRRKYFISGPQWAAAYEGNALFHAPTRGTLDFDTVIPGHGPIATRADVVTFKADLEAMRTRVTALIKSGGSRDAVVRMMENDYGWRATGCPPSPPTAGCLQFQQIDAMIAELRTGTLNP